MSKKIPLLKISYPKLNSFINIIFIKLFILMTLFILFGFSPSETLSVFLWCYGSACVLNSLACAWILSQKEELVLKTVVLGKNGGMFCSRLYFSIDFIYHVLIMSFLTFHGFIQVAGLGLVNVLASFVVHIYCRFIYKNYIHIPAMKKFLEASEEIRKNCDSLLFKEEND